MSLSTAFKGGLADSYADARTLSTGISEHSAALAGAVKTSKLTATLDVSTSAAAANALAALPKIQCFSSIFFRKMIRKIVFISVALFSKSRSVRQKDQDALLPAGSRSRLLCEIKWRKNTEQQGPLFPASLRGGDPARRRPFRPAQASW
jgi:hypothetical protein